MARTASPPSPKRVDARGSRATIGLLTFAVGVVLFFPGLLLHEVLHVLVLHVLGGQGLLIVRPWAFALIDLSLPSLHVQPIPDLDVGRQIVFNFFGPALAAVIFAIPLLYLRQRTLRLALIANVAVLVFYAVIEAGYVLADVYLHLELGVLVTPEFNYGVPLVIYLAAALVAARGRPSLQTRSDVSRDGVRDDAGHRRDEVRPGVE